MLTLLAQIVTFVPKWGIWSFIILLSVSAHAGSQPFEKREKFIGLRIPPYNLGHEISLKTGQSIPIAPVGLIWQIAKIETQPVNVFSNAPEAEIEFVLVARPPPEKVNRRVEVGGQTFGSSYLGNIRIEFGEKGQLMWTSWAEVEDMVEKTLTVGVTKVVFASGEQPSTLTFPTGYYWQEIQRIPAKVLQTQTGQHQDYDQVTYVLNKSDRRLPNEINITHFISYWVPQKLPFGEAVPTSSGPTCEDSLKFGSGVFIER